MFLGQKVADEIRASFPCKDELDIRLAIRECWRADRDPRTLLDTLGLTNSGTRRLLSLAQWLDAERVRLE